LFLQISLEDYNKKKFKLKLKYNKMNLFLNTLLQKGIIILFDTKRKIVAKEEVQIL
jgi:hypothetical protein